LESTKASRSGLINARLLKRSPILFFITCSVAQKPFPTPSLNYIWFFHQLFFSFFPLITLRIK
jgi:hypothetical protein